MDEIIPQTPEDILKEAVEQKRKEIKLQEKKIEQEKEIQKKLKKHLQQREKALTIYKLTKDA